MKLLPKSPKKKLVAIKKAFTLIELLIVITIIGILTSMTYYNFENARMKARDSKRKSDMKAIQTAIELFREDNGYYPSEDENGSLATLGKDKLSCSTSENPNDNINWGGAWTCGGKTYMTQLPNDPQGLAPTRRYYYEIYDAPPVGTDPPFWCRTKVGAGPGNDQCFQYTIWTRLENTKDPDIAATTADTICHDSITYPTGNDPTFENSPYSVNYCVHGPT